MRTLLHLAHREGTSVVEPGGGENRIGLAKTSEIRRTGVGRRR